ncbi:MAG: DUF2256 domain-containing protein [Bacteroidia bacterium]|nr:DUF2256 domain-containing protein [Bacteroidia bacterium]
MRGVRKEHLPSKICATCNKPFTWRKKWERNWEQVTHCSDRCRSNRNKLMMIK